MFRINVTLYASVLSCWIPKMKHIPRNSVDRVDNEPPQLLPPTIPGTIMKQPLREAVRREGPVVAGTSGTVAALTNLIPLPVTCNLYCADQ
jgi:hypothetical protein